MKDEQELELDDLLTDEVREATDIGELSLEDLNAELEEEAGVDDVLDFMDNLVKKDKRDNVKRSKKSLEEWNKPVPFTQVWYPEAIALRAKRQMCRCGSAHYFTEGTYLRSITKNGAVKWTNLTEEGILSHKDLPKEIDITEEEIAHCFDCWGN